MASGSSALATPPQPRLESEVGYQPASCGTTRYAAFGIGAGAFGEYFEPWKLKLPRALGAGIDTINEAGWNIRWLATDRGDRAFLDFVILPAGCSPAAEEEHRRRWSRHNDCVWQLVRRKFERQP